MNNSLVLDTHALIWIINGNESLNKKAVKLITDITSDGNLIVPAISFWEISMLEQKQKIKFSTPINSWIEDLLDLPYIKIAHLTPEVSMESCNLPGEFHGDPADRMIVATARLLDAPLVTRDKKIIKYAKTSYLNIIEI